nr:MAG TPA: hypothetical protein [Caudoviricetes sp.]
MPYIVVFATHISLLKSPKVTKIFSRISFA